MVEGLNMSLVSYDYDSATDEENEERYNHVSNLNSEYDKPNNEERVLKVNPTYDKTVNKAQVEQQTDNAIKIIIDEDQIEDFIPKSQPHVKEKQKVKITIPSLSDFADLEDDEPISKKSKPSNKGSGLISMLPPVKGSVMTAKSFIPKSVANKNQNEESAKDTQSKKCNIRIPKTVRQKIEAKNIEQLQKIKTNGRKDGSDIESDDDIDLPETFDDDMWQKVCGRPKPKQITKVPEEIHPQNIIDIAPEPATPYEGLDNKAFKELVGKSKRPIGNIKLIDINEEEILPEKDLWLTKSLTDPELAPKPQIEDPVDPTRRKKHHITYLAQQAKANEQELQNTWAASRNNRTASRAKYGF
ncbi:hypothetical protein NQ317_004036 [Molorchus minor]|uniref:Proline-rich protein PRCC n=1 Tax=Molorchus minor TaxID=1323400 RepID=A0ABQ9JT70_9CUCU|nr:hypothetical protein NQ317_004036 [Molorchus minor]